MNAMTNMLSVQTMTSRELSRVVNATHDSVLKTIRRLVVEGVVSSNETPYKHEQNGQQYPEFLLNYRDTMVVASGYSAELRARVIDRWLELEAAAKASASAIPQSFSAALRLAAEQAEVIEAQAAQLAIAAPAVEFVESYVASTSGSKGFRAVAKLLEIKEPAFRAFLKEEGIMYQLGGEWMPHAQHLDAGRFEVRAGTAETSGHAYNTAKFTPKGVNWIAGKLAVWKLQQVAA